MRFAAALMLVLSLGGCALTEDFVPVDYKAPANLTVVSGAGDIVVAVDGKDNRASNKDRVSTKKNGYGMEMAPIRAQNDVVDLARRAVEQELSSLGFKIGPGGLKAVVEIQTFYSDFKIGFFAGDAVAEVAFNFVISRSDGSLVFSKAYRGIGMNKNIQLALGSNAKPALEEALSNAMAEFIKDSDMHSALVNTVPRASKPVAAKAPGS